MRISGLNEIAPFVLGTALLFGNCGGTPPTANSGQPAAPAASVAPSVQPSPLTDFEEAVRFVRNGQYTYIWVFSRKDGKPFTPADSIFLKVNAPQLVDVTATKDKTKAVGGTNFDLEEGNMELLKKRFVVEDYSKK